MKRLITLVFLLSAAAIGSAGYQSTRLVYFGSSHASGSLGAVRSSADATQYIGCYIYGNEAYKSVTCYARNSTGNFASCYSDNVALVDVAGRMNGDSYVSFSFNAAADCMSIRVDTYSYDMPKQ